MIRERVENEQFILEITLKIKDPKVDADYYEQNIKNLTYLIAAGLSSGEAFSVFMKYLVEVGKKFLVTMQAKQVERRVR